MVMSSRILHNAERETLGISGSAQRRPLHAVVRWPQRTSGHCIVHGARLRTGGYFGLVLRLKLYAAHSQRSASDAPRLGVT